MENITTRSYVTGKFGGHLGNYEPEKEKIEANVNEEPLPLTGIKFNTAVEDAKSDFSSDSPEHEEEPLLPTQYNGSKKSTTKL